jgi:hypothetical protein
VPVGAKIMTLMIASVAVAYAVATLRSDDPTKPHRGQVGDVCSRDADCENFMCLHSGWSDGGHCTRKCTTAGDCPATFECVVAVRSFLPYVDPATVRDGFNVCARGSAGDEREREPEP